MLLFDWKKFWYRSDCPWILFLSLRNSVQKAVQMTLYNTEVMSLNGQIDEDDSFGTAYTMTISSNCFFMCDMQKCLSRLLYLKTDTSAGNIPCHVKTVFWLSLLSSLVRKLIHIPLSDLRWLLENLDSLYNVIQNVWNFFRNANSTFCTVGNAF